MQSEYLILAKSHLQYVVSKRARLGVDTDCNTVLEEAQLAVQIAQVEATERLAAALAGDQYPEETLPFQDLRIRCVHGAFMGDACEPCDAVIDMAERVYSVEKALELEH